MKISEYLKHLNSHTIYAADAIRGELLKETQVAIPEVGRYARDILKSLAYDDRSATIYTQNDKELLISGFELAEILAKKFCNEKALTTLRRLNGRGSRYRAAIKALEEAGR